MAGFFVLECPAVALLWWQRLLSTRRLGEFRSSGLNVVVNACKEGVNACFVALILICYVVSV